MKKLSYFLVFFGLLFRMNLSAKTICTMTFNSPDEKQSFKRNLSTYDYDFLELVPANKDPEWFSKACNNVKSCDILVISGHFGGLFFGEQSSATISLNELITARERATCPAILDSVKAVYLMGCNTLSSKSPDHRSVNDYLRVLVGDGFPLNLAEEVAASRYLNFGQSMADFMTSIFSKSQMVVGFESTGPLGAQAAPILDRAFKATSKKDKETTGLSKEALLSAFKATNLRVVKPEAKIEDALKVEALSENETIARQGWNKILNPTNLSKNYDFIIKNQSNVYLIKTLSENPKLAQTVYESMLNIFRAANGLSEIQVKVVTFLRYHNLIIQEYYESGLLAISTNILSRDLDYISADQLCSVLKNHRDVNILSMLNNTQREKIVRSIYGNYLTKCGGFAAPRPTFSKAYQCLTSGELDDWNCLIENSKDLNVDACALAKGRNPDGENADDMLWFCYDKMRDSKILNRASCLELTHHFSLLGNQIKMNWNCINRVSN